MEENGKKQRVILINGDSTKWYEQAIFIVKKDAAGAEMPLDFVAEAEKIINEYTRRKKMPNPYAVYQNQSAVSKQHSSITRRQSNVSVNVFLNALMLISCALLVTVLYCFFK